MDALRRIVDTKTASQQLPNEESQGSTKHGFNKLASKYKVKSMKEIPIKIKVPKS